MTDTTTESDRARDPRGRMVRAAVELLARGGRDAASTRAVSAAAGVQPPAIYRQFGDMRGLLDAAARETFAEYVRQKAARARADDPVEDLRRGWDLHVAFGLANPAAYALIYGETAGRLGREADSATALGSAAEARSAVPPEAPSEADSATRDSSLAHLQTLVDRVAAAGRLRVGVPHATRLIAAAGHGVTLALVAARPGVRDPRLSESMREAVLAAITVADSAAAGDGGDTTGPARETARTTARAVALRAVLAEEAPEVLSPAERHLLGEWLDRLAGAGG